jgi:hypothetical protein
METKVETEGATQTETTHGAGRERGQQTHTQRGVGERQPQRHAPTRASTAPHLHAARRRRPRQQLSNSVQDVLRERREQDEACGPAAAVQQPG